MEQPVRPPLRLAPPPRAASCGPALAQASRALHEVGKLGKVLDPSELHCGLLESSPALSDTPKPAASSQGHLSSSRLLQSLLSPKGTLSLRRVPSTRSRKLPEEGVSGAPASALHHQQLIQFFFIRTFNY